MSKRYLLFYGDAYYPAGGWGDFRGAFDTIEEAHAAYMKAPGWKPDWWHVVDLETLKEIDSV